MCNTKVGWAIMRAEHVKLLWVSCEARGLSKLRHGIAVSTGTVVWNTGILRGMCVQYQSYTGDDECRTRRDTVGFMRETRVCVARRVTVGFM